METNSMVGRVIVGCFLWTAGVVMINEYVSEGEITRRSFIAIVAFGTLGVIGAALWRLMTMQGPKVESGSRRSAIERVHRRRD